MNPIIVFAKTDAGEDAVQQRTRLVQRNLRTVLILVDGKSTVEDLVEKAGSIEMVTLALDQLEKDGFIRRVGTGSRREKVVVQPLADHSPDASLASAASAPAAPAPKSAKVSVEVNIDGIEMDEEPPLNLPAIKAAADSRPKSTAAPVSPFAIATPAKPSASPFLATPPAADLSGFSLPPASIGKPLAQPSANVASPFQTSAGSPFGGSPFDNASTSAPKPASPKATVPNSATEPDEPFRPYRRRKTILTPKVIFGTLGGLLLVLLLVIMFFPYGNYLPEIEATLSRALGQKVRIGSVGASFVPTPALVLSQLSVGEGAQITVGEVRATPSVFSMMMGKKAFSQITLINTQVPMEQVGLLASGLGSAAKSESFSIGGVVFSGITLGLRDLSLSGYSGRAEMTSTGGLKRMDLVSPDRTIKVGVETSSGATLVSIEGTNWKPGESSPYLFDSLSISGELTGTRLQAQKIEGRIFGGVMQGQFELDWSAGMTVNGDISVDYMSAPQLATALGSGKLSIDGQMNARIRFRASGESWNALSGKVPLEGDVIVKTGSISGMDMVEAVRRGSNLAMRGGTTRFEQAVGKFRWDGQSLRIHDIDLSSGVMRATGSLGVLKGDQLSGALSVVLRGSATTVTTPVSIAGTLQDPQLFGGRR